MKAVPQSPPQRLGAPISEDLEELILAYLAKNPNDRRSRADVLEVKLLSCQSAHPWTKTDAKTWRAEHLDSKSVSITETIEKLTTDDALNETMIKPQTG